MKTKPTDVADLPTLVRWRKAVQALSRIMMNPEQTDQVLLFSALVNAGQRDERLHEFYDDARGQKLYAEQRTIDSHTLDLDALAKLPEGTLGHAYATFLKSRGLTPEVFDGRPEAVRDDRAAYLIQRLRQTHDLWHVVTNAGTDPGGEIALQAFTFAQVHAPSSAILAVLGTLRTLRYTREVMRDAIAMYRLGLAAASLPHFGWEDHWATPLVEVRRLLGLPAQPPAVGGRLDAILAAAAA